MIGQAIAALEKFPRRMAKSLLGTTDMDARQKWLVLWPLLARLGRKPIRILDAGCGPGHWVLELAARHPDWAVDGVDRNELALQEANEALDHLGLQNAHFLQADFAAFRPEQRYDLVLSVASAHYAITAGNGKELFQQFRRWTRPGGHLYLLCNRRAEEVPFTRRVAIPPLSPGVSRQGLEEASTTAGWTVDSIRYCVGRLGTLAKQLAYQGKRQRSLRWGLQSCSHILSAADRISFDGTGESSFIVLIARNGGD